MLSQLLQWLDSNPWLNAAFLVLAVLSIMVTVFLYFLSRREIVPRYRVKSFPLISKRVQQVKGLQVLHNGEPVANITATMISLWNQGSLTLNSNDIAPSDPIRVEFDSGIRPLHVELVHSSKQANNCAVEIRESAVHITFDYLHTWQGLVLRIFHTGATGKGVHLRGTIKSVKEIRKVEPLDDPLTDSWLNPLAEKLRSVLGPRWIVLVFVVLTVPLMALTLPIDMITKPFRWLRRRLPRELDLDYQ